MFRGMMHPLNRKPAGKHESVPKLVCSTVRNRNKKMCGVRFKCLNNLLRITYMFKHFTQYDVVEHAFKLYRIDVLEIDPKTIEPKRPILSQHCFGNVGNRDNTAFLFELNREERIATTDIYYLGPCRNNVEHNNLPRL